MRPGGLLALDLASWTGWSYAYPGDRPVWGRRRMAEPGASPGAVFDGAAKWLERQLAELQPIRVYAEDQYLGKVVMPDVIRRLYGLRAVTQMVCHQHDLPLEWVTASRVTKFFTAFGRWPDRAEKKAATMRVCKMYGWEPKSDDEADALAILIYAEHQVVPTAAAGRSIGTLWAKGA